MDDDVNFCLFCHGTEDLMANNLGDILYECIVWLTCIEIKSKNLMSGTVTTGLSHYGLSMAVRDEFLSIWANTWTSLREILMGGWNTKFCSAWSKFGDFRAKASSPKQTPVPSFFFSCPWHQLIFVVTFCIICDEYMIVWNFTCCHLDSELWLYALKIFSLISHLLTSIFKLILCKMFVIGLQKGCHYWVCSCHSSTSIQKNLFHFIRERSLIYLCSDKGFTPSPGGSLRN